MTGTNPPRAPVSVVIPTLGGSSLAETIRKVSLGSVVPTEILVCIPEGYQIQGDLPDDPNIRIVRTRVKGQVKQRIAGFEECTQPFVMQLDDDSWPDAQCVERLLETIRDRPDVSASPTLRDRETGGLVQWMSQPTASDSWARRWLFTLANGSAGYRAGKLSKAGIGMGFSESMTEPYEVEWVPGACVMHHRRNLVTENFYPFAGKAYGEDLFHSLALRRRQVRLYHCPSAGCGIDFSSSKSSGLKSFLQIHFRTTRALLTLASASGASRTRVLAYMMLWPVVLVLQRGRAGATATKP